MKIIAVDGEEAALENLLDSINRAIAGAEICGFADPEAAIAFARENGCDAAFLEIKMHGMTGLELAERLMSIVSGINIIFVTGYPGYALEAFRLYASDYILKPVTPDLIKQAMGHLRTPIRRHAEKRLSIRCFGNFEVFADGRPIAFRRSKSKELLAYLVDKRGAACTMGELMTAIWDNGPDSPSRQSNLRNLISDLKRSLADAGADGVIIKGRNSMSVDINAVSCDYYDFLRRLPYAAGSYRGEYMTQYSWAEITTASLPVMPKHELG